MPGIHDLPGVIHVVRGPAPAVATATTTETVLGTVPFKGVVSLAKFTALTTLTGAATNNRTMAIFNRKGDGSGTTSIAALTYASGVNATALVPSVLTLSTTASDLQVAAGDVLTLVSTANASGLAQPVGAIQVDIQGA